MEVHPAFEVCGSGKCKKPKLDAKSAKKPLEKRDNHVKCLGSLKENEGVPCRKPCQCMLFVREKNAKKDALWEFAFPDADGDVDNDDDKEFTCLCVKPVLPSGYELCQRGECPEWQKSEKSDDGIFCKPDADKCKGENCDCHLFRLERNQKSKWEHVSESGAKNAKKADHTKYYYACFCVELT